MLVLASEEWPQPHVHCELSEVQPRKSFRTQKPHTPARIPG